MYPVKRVNPDLAENLEPLGTKRKYWFREGDTRLLFKAEERGTGEDWAEKIACELCALLGLPHVRYDLAVEVGTAKPGVVCASCASPPMALVLGNQLLFAIDESYPKGQGFRVQAHTVGAVAQAVGLIQPPSAAWMTNVPVGIASAIDVFIGYVMLDAWTANQDRHHENWAVLWDGKTLSLAPTFDHGAALARNLTDEERKQRLTTRDARFGVPAFAAKARSAFFGDAATSRPMKTCGAWRAFAARSPKAAAAWRARLAAIDEPTVRGVLDEVPPSRMSAVAKAFTMALLKENRRRILADENE